nr:MAG TPA: hypothetical protein [Caudoviricetes sp.]
MRFILIYIYEAYSLLASLSGDTPSRFCKCLVSDRINYLKEKMQLSEGF